MEPSERNEVDAAQRQVEESETIRCLPVSINGVPWAEHLKAIREAREEIAKLQQAVRLPRTVLGWLFVACVLLVVKSASAQRAEITFAQVKLGEKLFNERLLSIDGTVSCASCHQAHRGTSDGLPVARGVGGLLGTRNTPQLWGVVTLEAARLNTDQLLFHDGRTNGRVRNGRVVLASTSVQATQPLVNPLEMAFPNGDGRGVERAMQRLRSAGYGPLFRQVYGDGRITAERYGNAMTAYLATLQSNDAPIDRRLQGYSRALSPAAERGFQLVSAAGCMSCHTPRAGRFTDAGFHNNGYTFFSRGRDPGRIGILPAGSPRNNTTVRAFKTANWEELQDSGPYMHDGSAPTLEAVVEAYQCGMTRNAIVNGRNLLARDAFIDARILPNPWPASENPNVVAFLREAFRGRSRTNGVQPSLPRGLAVRR